MICVSGKHDWIDPVSAARCCRPGWSRKLRGRKDPPLPGEVSGGTIYQDWLDTVRVWCYRAV